MINKMNSLLAISPLDGRYRNKIEELSNFFSEFSFFKYRTLVEIEYLISLSELSGTDLKEFSENEKEDLREIYRNFSLEYAVIIKEHEILTNHDLKALEYFLKERLEKLGLEKYIEWVHFALTSEDINNLAYAIMITKSRDEILNPILEELFRNLESMSDASTDIKILARTHGQPATPSSMSKEIKVFSSRLCRQIEQLKSLTLQAKLNGAVGNFSAHKAAYPKIDWQDFSSNFINALAEKLKIKLDPNLYTTQIEAHDSLSEFFDNLRRINTIVLDLNQDFWRYISDGWIVQKAIENEVGSSTMPHKINPIDFENSEGNLGLANALLEFFSRKLPISRLQRDLSDSTVLRNIGLALGYSLLAYKSTLKGLSKIDFDREKIKNDLKEHPEVLAEAIQTILRSKGKKAPYEKLKDLSRGKKIHKEDLLNLLRSEGIEIKLHEIPSID